MYKFRFTLMLAVMFSVIFSLRVVYAQGGGNMHYVTYGETLYSIATRYGVTVDDMLRFNGLSNPNMIYIGQPLAIPAPYPTAGGYAPGGGLMAPSGGYGPSMPPGGGYMAPVSGYGCASYHTVAAGETLSNIAFNYGVPLQNLAGQNNLYNQDMVFVGQKICLPAMVGYAPQSAGYIQYGPPAYRHTVASGETVALIAAQYGVNSLDIAQINGLSNAGLIYVGQQLAIPSYQPMAAPMYNPPAGAPYGAMPQGMAAPQVAPALPVGPLVAEIQVAPLYHHGDMAGPPPPPAPLYDGGYQDTPPAPGPLPASGSHETTPPAPNYEAGAPRPLLPQADQPVVVKVNAGETWVGEGVEFDAKNDDRTILIVKNAEGNFKPIIHMQSGDYEVKGEFGHDPEFGFGSPTFAFRYIPDGDYDVWLEDPQTPSQRVQVQMNSGKRVEINFKLGHSFVGPTYASPDGWVLADWNNPSRPPRENIGGWSNILVKTPASGLRVMIESEGGGYKATCFTGSKGPGACDLAGLNAGMYNIWIDGTQLTLQTWMDGAAYAEFTFARQPILEGGGAEANKVGPVRYSPALGEDASDDTPTVELHR